MKYFTLYGPGQLFVSLAVMILGMHIIALSSIGYLPEKYLIVGSVSVFTSLILVMLNIRSHIVTW